MINLVQTSFLRGFPGGSDGKESIYNAGDAGSIPDVRKIPWRRKRLPILVFLLENPIDTGDWQARVHGVSKSQT